MESGSGGPQRFRRKRKRDSCMEVRSNSRHSRVARATGFFSEWNYAVNCSQARDLYKVRKRSGNYGYRRAKCARRPSAVIDRRGDNFIPMKHPIFRISI